MKVYYCSDCNLKFYDQHIYACHRKWKHPKDENFYCKKCQKHFKFKCGLRKHEKHCDVIEKACVVCGNKFKINNSKASERKKIFCSTSCVNKLRKHSTDIREKISKKAIERIKKQGPVIALTRRNKTELLIENHLIEQGLENKFVSQFKFINELVKKFKKSDILFFDFYFECKKIDLEIDGVFHTYPDRIEYDHKRDEVLKQLNIYVYRISYHKNFSLIKKQIDLFIDFFNNYKGEMAESGLLRRS